MNKARILVFIGLLISMEIILTRFLSFQTPIVRVSFGFIPIALCAMLFGPVAGGIAGAMSDIIGMMIFPKGAYFPGFTLSALITGAVYGLFLYRNQKSIIRTILAVLVVTLVVDVGMNTLWLTMITSKAASALIVPRLIKGAIMFPAQVILITAVWKYAGSFIQANYFKDRVET
ncbi:MAG: folate family ECF transporter S component [Clostridia bacterium]|nr:folate family ECF transporter S component [Clostridia bacterium]